jgi:UrcA family protein
MSFDAPNGLYYGQLDHFWLDCGWGALNWRVSPMILKDHISVIYGAAGAPRERASARERATIISLILCGSIALGCISAANADTTDTLAPPTRTVRYADLNLENVRDAKTLYARIKGAAKSVCSSSSPSGSNNQGAWKRCYHDAVSTAVVRVNNPLVTAVHAGTRKRTTGVRPLQLQTRRPHLSRSFHRGPRDSGRCHFRADEVHEAARTRTVR